MRTTWVRRSVLPPLREGTPQHGFRLFQDQLTNHLTADFGAHLPRSAEAEAALALYVLPR